MKEKFSISNLQFVYKIWVFVVYFVLFIVLGLLFLGRNNESLRLEFVTDIHSSFYRHYTNFIISFVICFVTGFMEVWFEQKLKRTMVIAGLLILANYLYEWYIPILNTLDKVDGYYGFAGSLLPLPLLYLMLRFGLKPNPIYQA